MLACAEEASAEGRFAHDLASCMDAVFVGILQEEANTFSEYWMVHQEFVDGTGHLWLTFFDLVAGLPDYYFPMPIWNCSGAFAGVCDNPKNMQPDYHNFSKYGPVDPGLGWGNHFARTVSIYGAKQQIIGEFQCQLRLDDGIERIFAAISLLAR